LLHGELVTLRPLREEEFDVLWAARQKAAPSVSPAGPNPEELRQRIESSGRLTPWGLALGIEASGELVGEIQAYRGQMPPGVFGIGIDLFHGDDRGRGYGTEAVSMLVRHLFDRQAARRVEGGTTLDNVAMRRVFGRLGFVEEGVLREFLPTVAGGGTDCVMYGMTRTDYEGVKGRWIRTS
jgi:RimJ/RimL family protein N-acetyltransferase